MSTSTIVFIPTSAERAHQLVAAPGKQVTAFTVTEELQSILDVTDPEETEHAAMVIGSVWGLTHTGRRLVLVAHVPSEQITDHEEVDNGGVTLTHLELLRSPRGSLMMTTLTHGRRRRQSRA
ncbi:hypothetical protein JCM18920_1545 [Cutibacterium acnes JCM 18920]|nr:hypothetical protein JCM18920_1545 [Cutibacterium acnes JCM 18920]